LIAIAAAEGMLVDFFGAMVYDLFVEICSQMGIFDKQLLESWLL